MQNKTSHYHSNTGLTVPQQSEFCSFSYRSCRKLLGLSDAERISM